MNFKRIIREGVQSLQANRIRSGLSVLGIVFGVASVVAMLAVIEGARNDVLERLSKLGTNVLFVLNQDGTKAGTRSLQFGDSIRLMQSSDFIASVAPAAVVQNKHSVDGPTLIGVTSTYISVRQLVLQSGRNISDLDLQNRVRVCVIGREVVGEDGKSVGIGDVLQLGNYAYRIIGVIASSSSMKDRSLGSLLRNHNKSALVPMTALPRSREIIDAKIPLTEISIRNHKAGDLLPLRNVVDRALQSGQTTKPSFNIVIPRQLLRQEQHAQRVFAVVVGCVALIAVLVGAIGVMNIMLANVAERCNEIGIRRAIGATKKQIAVLFLSESILLTTFGGIGGLLLGIAASLGIAHFGGWTVSISSWSLLLAIGMAGIVGLGAGWFPAKRAASLDPVESMRRE